MKEEESRTVGNCKVVVSSCAMVVEVRTNYFQLICTIT